MFKDFDISSFKKQKPPSNNSFQTTQEVKDALIERWNKNKAQLAKFGTPDSPYYSHKEGYIRSSEPFGIQRIEDDNAAILNILKIDHNTVSEGGLFINLGELPSKQELLAQKDKDSRNRALTDPKEVVDQALIDPKEIAQNIARLGGRNPTTETSTTETPIPYIPSTVFDSVDAAGQPQVLTRNQRKAWEIENKWPGAEAQFNAIPSQEEKTTPTPIPESGAVSEETALKTKAGQAAMALKLAAKMTKPEDSWVIPGGRMSGAFPYIA